MQGRNQQIMRGEGDIPFDAVHLFSAVRGRVGAESSGLRAPVRQTNPILAEEASAWIID